MCTPTNTIRVPDASQARMKFSAYAISSCAWGRDVQRGPDPGQGAPQRGLVTEVADDLLHPGAEAARSPCTDQHPDGGPVLAEDIENGTADGPGGSNHQHRSVKINSSDGHGISSTDGDGSAIGNRY